MLKYPVGIQTFDDVINGGYVYVDKTDLVYQLADMGKYYFLSRPRRFGKSLLISTLKAYFEGRKELFKGLKIDLLETQWEQYPVLAMSLNSRNFKDEQSLIDELNKHLNLWEEKFEVTTPADKAPEERFFLMVKRVSDKTGKQVVILIDEYDKPLLATLDEEQRGLNNAFRQALKAFFTVLKDQDQYIRFALLTGVTRFSKVSIFSDLNNLTDISMLPQYHRICGITDEELDEYCREGIQRLADAKGVDYAAMRQQLRDKYDGYHFTEDVAGVYNPFSVIKSLQFMRLDNYWFSSGTPTFLMRLLQDSHLPLDKLTQGKQTAQQLESIENFTANPLPIMFQSGYLTITGYDTFFKEYQLGFPNEEVRQGFTEALVPVFLANNGDSPFDVREFVRDVLRGDAEQFMQRLQTLYANLDYQIMGDKELYFHNTLFVILMMMGLYVRVERHNSRGRCDVVIETDNYVYVMELKLDGSVDEALAQIDKQGYAEPYTMSGKQLFKIGVNFHDGGIADYHIVQ